MADPETNTGYVEVTGPDKKTYRFPKGTDKAGAIAYFKKKGIGVATPQQAKPTQPQPNYFQRTSQEAARRSEQEAAQAYGPESQKKPLTERISHGERSLGYGLAEVGSDVAGGIFNLKNLGALGAGLIHPAIPASYFGGTAAHDIPETMTRALHNPTPENFKQFYENLATLAMAGVGAGETGGKLGPLGEKIKPTPEGLRAKAAELNTKVLKQAEASAKDYKTSSALQVAQEHIVGTMKSLPDKIEMVRAQKAQAITQEAAKADAAGVTIDVTPDVQPIVTDALRVLNQKGTLDAGTIKELRGFLDQLSTQVGPGGARVPRNLKAMKPTDALALTSHDGLLSDTAQFTKARPDAVNNLARRVRYAMNQRIAQQLPDVMKMRGEESRLITAREAARENYARMLNDKVSMGRGILYSGAGTIGLYLGLRALGTLPMASIGSVVLLSSLARSVPSRTLRASLYTRAADLLDTTTRATNAPQGGAAGSAGGTPTPGGNAPTAPVTAPNRGLIGGVPQLGAPQNSAAAGGSGTAAGAALDTMFFQQAKAAKPNGSVSEWLQDAQALKLKNVAQSNTSSAAGAEPDVEMLRRLGTTTPPEPVKPKAVESKLGTPEEQARVRKAMEGRGAAKQDLESGVGAKNKAMMDRLDNLYERQSEDTRGSLRNAEAIQREITEIKRVLSGEAKGLELAKINKHIADRERLAQKRAVTTPGAQGKEGEIEAQIAQTSSPEIRSIALDAGYKKLATYDGGPEMVKALQKMAKDMQRVDPTYDEVEKLTEALTVLKEVTGQ